MKRSNKWLLLGVPLIGIILTAGVLLSLGFGTQTEYSEEKSSEEQPDETINRSVENYHKMQSFILAKVPEEDVFVKHLHSEHGTDQSTTDDLKASAIHTFYAAIETGNPHLLSGSLTPETYQGIWGDETDFTKREQAVTDYLVRLNPSDSLQQITYKMELDTYGSETLQGVITLTYAGTSTLEIPFEFVLYGEDFEPMYLLELETDLAA
ncbi:hypothetical protein [Planococcus lenghuensis]|uniref:Uncharacterized protein n=1 Tax=Planococcus lenghuensis TaxID=2213202 RepID=A0A1Q2L4F4_9BACL|nr:hypothetical protein [Planococcus lenghuensis]AQQ55319.1 hypothetical protein B0X71_19280 [Planococcus lenghuensis]